MNLLLTFHILGGLLLLLSITMLIPLSVALISQDGSHLPFIYSIAITALVGGLLFKGLKKSRKVEPGIREAFGMVTLSWLLFGLFGAMPYLFSGVTSSLMDALFESISGFTTTGSTVLSGLDSMQPSILLWRSLTQWMGGMGIIVLSLAILPILGVGGMQLFFAEAPGPSKDRLTPRIQDTAKLLWLVYLLLTGLQFLLLWIGGMGAFDSICHALTTMATGGFSTKDASLAGFDSLYIHWVVIFFMFLAGANFTLHFRVLKGELSAPFKSEEFKFYISLFFAAIVIVFLFQWTGHRGELGFVEVLTQSAFQVVSIGTSTGYGSADYELWHPVAQTLLVSLMLFGGMAGSTGGGMKMVRVLMIIKYSFYQLYHMIHPKAVHSIKLDHKPVNEEILHAIVGFAGLYVGVLIFGTLLVSISGADLGTASSAVISSLSNIGPGFGSVGPTENFAHLTDFAKGVLSLCMVIGRLEFYTALVLFLPSLWRQ